MHATTNKQSNTTDKAHTARPDKHNNHVRTPRQRANTTQPHRIRHKIIYTHRKFTRARTRQHKHKHAHILLALAGHGSEVGPNTWTHAHATRKRSQPRYCDANKLHKNSKILLMCGGRAAQRAHPHVRAPAAPHNHWQVRYASSVHVCITRLRARVKQC